MRSSFVCVAFLFGISGCGGGGRAPGLTTIPTEGQEVVGGEEAATELLEREDAGFLFDFGGEPQKGQFGAACATNGDCDSGICVEGPEGYVCTMTCVDQCPPGWLCRAMLIGADLVSLCVPAGADLCKPCTSDIQCGDGKCLKVGDGRFCGRDCSQFACPKGYECLEIEGAKQCYPKNGTCDCRVSSVGTQRLCVRENEYGRCLGYETCDLDLGWVGCTAAIPGPEECDGIDNDCNGVADDNPVPPGPECENTVPGVGSCKGKWVCRGEAGWDCIGPQPSLEVCNYLDDDCDGQTDEDFTDAQGRYVVLEHCGACGNSCIGKIPFAKEVACDSAAPKPRCVVVECEEGYYKAGDALCLAALSNLCMPCVDDANCGGQKDKCIEMISGKYCGRDCSEGSVFGAECPAGYECKAFSGGVKQCVPATGSCDCTVANAGMTRVCAKTNDYGTCYGTEVCDAALGWVNCTAKTPMAEVCNGLDDDCNGFVDDGVVEPATPCAKSWQDPVTGKTYTCSAPWQCKETGNGVGWVCEVKSPGPEICNYVDDNCDGQTDEDYKLPGTNKYAAFDHCGACGVSCEGMVQNGTAKCDATGPQPRCVVDKCDEGYWQASDLACLAFPSTLCMPCASDSACQVPGDRCVDVAGDGKKYCVWDCSEGSVHPKSGPGGGVCPEGYVCTDVGGGRKECRPRSGSCECLVGDEGKTRLCKVQNQYGTCIGVETCDPLVGFVGCTANTPGPERCNGLDDDCNGLTDEPFPELGAVCFVGIGECRRAGVMVCNETMDGVRCDATPGLPSAEVCDEKDNDCDGLVDEDWPTKGQACVAGQGECQRIGVFRCKADGSGIECSAVPGTPAVEKCDGKDNDCDGLVDEDWPNKGQVCLVGQGECQRAGILVCNGAGTGLECNATPGSPVAELCDDKDNDCDGQTDEDWPNKGQVCTVGTGVCLRTGTYVCNAAQTGVVCSATPGTGSPEVCDYLDNDCDGLTDEDFILNGKYYKDTACGNCYTDCTAIYNLPHAYGTCDYSGTPICRMNCVTQYFDLNAVPDDGCEFYLDSDAIYVSSADPFAADSANCGYGPAATGAGRFPCKTIGYGLSRAVTTGRSKVFVADGLYEETVTLVNGKSILGGFRQDTWERHVSSTLTVIRGTDTGFHRNTIIATGITSPTKVEGFVIYGQVNPNFGGNSYAIYIANSNANLHIANNVIYAGIGGPGLNGAAGVNGLPGVDGQGRDPSNPGAYDAFDTGQRPCQSSKDRWYDNGGKRTCGNDVVNGGRGGGNRCPPEGGTEYSGRDGLPGEPGDGALGGAAGAGGDAGDDGDIGYYLGGVVCYLPSNPMTGMDGQNGAPGKAGAAGAGCANSIGTIVGGHWVGSAGGRGGDGGNGGGGGGGGAGGGGDADISGYTDRLGGHGGGGGSGGCGGTGGEGGGPGGASIGIFVAGGQAPTITGNVVFQGVGGNGGDGGNGGVGGPGGHGGDGGICSGSCWCHDVGGKGGEGGQGGHGGGGGGGCGGASFGIVTAGIASPPNYCATNTVSGGLGGQGGQGGRSLGNNGASGAAGVSEKCFSF